MTVKQAAEYTNLRQETILRLIKKGSIEAERFGGHMWMIRKDSIDAFIERNKSKLPRDPTRK